MIGSEQEKNAMRGEKTAINVVYDKKCNTDGVYEPKIIHIIASNGFANKTNSNNYGATECGFQSTS